DGGDDGERPAFHYSITCSARASSDGGIVRPSALAVLRLMTSSNFVGCSMGRSAGFVPLRILLTYRAACRKPSVKSGPYDMRPPAAPYSRLMNIVGSRFLSAKWMSCRRALGVIVWLTTSASTRAFVISETASPKWYRPPTHLT